MAAKYDNQKELRMKYYAQETRWRDTPFWSIDKFDQFLCVDLEAVVLEEWTRDQTRFGEDSANTSYNLGYCLLSVSVRKGRRGSPAPFSTEIGGFGAQA